LLNSKEDLPYLIAGFSILTLWFASVLYRGDTMPQMESFIILALAAIIVWFPKIKRLFKRLFNIFK
jgi:hypothetical protein